MNKKIESKKSFIFYIDWWDILQQFNDTEKWELINALIQYVAGVDVSNIWGDRRDMAVAFLTLKRAVDRDTKKWEERAERSRENGKKGGRPPKESEDEMF